MIDEGEILEVANKAGIDPDSTLVDAIYDIACEYKSLKRTEVKGTSALRKSLTAIKVNLGRAFDGISSLSRSDERAISQLAGIYRSEFRLGPKNLNSDVKAVEQKAYRRGCLSAGSVGGGSGRCSQVRRQTCGKARFDLANPV